MLSRTQLSQSAGHLKKRTWQVHCDPFPFAVEHGGRIRRRVGFAVDFETDTVINQAAQLGGHLAELKLRRYRLKAGAYSETY
jgi:hypothetical protein